VLPLGIKAFLIKWLRTLSGQVSAIHEVEANLLKVGTLVEPLGYGGVEAAWTARCYCGIWPKGSDIPLSASVVARQKLLIGRLKRPQDIAEAQALLGLFEDVQKLNLADMNRLGNEAREAAVNGAPANQMAKKTRSLDDAKNWRDKAAHARAVAQSLADPQSKRLMLEIAERYGLLVKHAEERDTVKTGALRQWPRRVPYGQ
jgi:hypothetical protein